MISKNMNKIMNLPQLFDYFNWIQAPVNQVAKTDEQILVIIDIDCFKKLHYFAVVTVDIADDKFSGHKILNFDPYLVRG